MHQLRVSTLNHKKYRGVFNSLCADLNPLSAVLRFMLHDCVPRSALHLQFTYSSQRHRRGQDVRFNGDQLLVRTARMDIKHLGRTVMAHTRSKIFDDQTLSHSCCRCLKNDEKNLSSSPVNPRSGGRLQHLAILLDTSHTRRPTGSEH